MIRISVAAAALALAAAATPAFADGFGYEARTPYNDAPASYYDEHAGQPAADYSGRYSAHDEHCAGARKVVVEEDDYGQRIVRTGPNYGYPNYRY